MLNSTSCENQTQENKAILIENHESKPPTQPLFVSGEKYV